MAYDALQDILNNREITPDQQRHLIGIKDEFKNKEDLNSYISDHYKQTEKNSNNKEQDGQKNNKEKEEEKQKPSDGRPSGNNEQTQEGNQTGPAGGQQGQETPVAGNQLKPKTPEELAEMAKAAERKSIEDDFKKLYGVELNSPEGQKAAANLGPVNIQKRLENGGKGESVEELAKLQLGVRMAEFHVKHEPGNDPVVENNYKKVLDNKDKINDSILRHLEGYATGDTKISDGLNSEIGVKDSNGKTSYDRQKLRKDSVNMLMINAPTELRKHCKTTIGLAWARVNPQREGVSSERLAKANAQKLKYKSMQIRDEDGLWTRAKKTAQMKAFVTTRSAQKGLKKWARNNPVSKGVKKVVNKINKGNSKVDRFFLSVSNRASLFPSRAKKAITNGFKKYSKKLTTWFKGTKVGKFLKSSKDRVVKFGKDSKNWVVDKGKQLGNGAKKVVQYVKDNPKKCLAAGIVGAGFVLGGPAGGVAAAKVVGVGLAAYGAGKAVTKGVKYGVKKGKEAKDSIVNKGKELNDKAKESLKQTFEKDQQKVPNPNDTDKEISYANGRKIVNENPEIMAAYQGIISEGNEGKPKTDKEAATQLYQQMTNEKDKGGLGLNQEQAKDVLSYYSQNSGGKVADFEGIKDEINKPVSEEKGKEEKAQEQPTSTQEKAQEKEANEQETPQPRSQPENPAPTQEENKEQGQPQPTSTQEKPKRKKVSEDVLIQELEKMDKDHPRGEGQTSRVHDYRQAKSQFKITKDSFGEKKAYDEGFKPFKKVMSDLNKENPELAGAFADTLERTGAVKKGSFDKVLGREGQETKKEGTAKYAEQNMNKFKQKGGAEM